MPLREMTSEDMARATVYRILARFLSAPATETDLQAGAGLTGDGTPLGRAITAFSAACAEVEPGAAAEQYHDLFIGLARGELVPYACFYLTGFLNEKPLVRLRQDLSRLGLARDPDIRDPEDHAASVCEIMANLIEGAGARGPVPLDVQRAFFREHVGSWLPIFFTDLEAVAGSPFYAALGRVGRVFMEIETESLDMS